MRILHYFTRNPRLTLLVSFLGICCIGGMDLLTNYEFSLFYVLPIAAITWVGGKYWGIFASCLSALIWLIAETMFQYMALTPSPTTLWNTLIRSSFFLIITFLLAALRTALEKEQLLARHDGLTGAANARHLYELVEREIARFERYGTPFTIAYMDLDNFKQINDHYGHAIGDQVLTTIVQQSSQIVRKVDTIARIGGDEFAFLFPNTDEKVAPLILTKLQNQLIQVMQAQQWPVTLSIGVLTCHAPNVDVHALLQQVDQLMYAVKNSTKNAIRYASIGRELKDDQP